MWVEPFSRCAQPFHHFHHFLLDRPPVILPQSQPSLSLTAPTPFHLHISFQHLSTFTRSDKKQVSVVAYFWKHIHGAQKRKHLPLSALCQACPKLSSSTKERKQYSFTHTLCQVSFQFHIHYFTCAGCVCEMCDCMTPWARRVRNCPYPLTVFCSQCPSISTDHYKYKILFRLPNPILATWLLLPYFSAGDSSVLGSQFRDIVLERSALEPNCGGEDGGEDGGDGGGDDCENDNDTLNIQGLVLTARAKCVLMTSLYTPTNSVGVTLVSLEWSSPSLSSSPSVP